MIILFHKDLSCHRCQFCPLTDILTCDSDTKEMNCYTSQGKSRKIKLHSQRIYITFETRGLKELNVFMLHLMQLHERPFASQFCEAALITTFRVHCYSQISHFVYHI